MQPKTNVNGARVLVVDDTESSRYVFVTWLRRAGYEVAEATTGDEALRSVASFDPDLVVLDINLPDTTGYVVCETIKRDPATASLPVLHVSATSVEASDRSEGLRRGAEGFLVEPVEREELLATVEALLRSAFAQRTATRIAARLQRLNEAALAVVNAQTFEHVVATTVNEGCALFEAPVGMELTVGDQTFRALASPGAPPVAVPLDAPARGSIARSFRDPHAVAEFEGFGPHRGMIYVQCLPDGTKGPPPAEVEVMLAQFALSVGARVRNLRAYEAERRFAIALQRGFLPAALPQIQGLDIATLYEASEDHAEVGGDFYDAFEIGGERVLLAIGDVVGHSLEAAAVMGQLRAGLRAYALEGHSPSAIVERMDRLLHEYHRETIATACCIAYEPRTGACEIANAGHLPPLVLGPKGPRYLPLGGPLLGLNLPGTPPHRFTLDAGEVLVLFTDGLVERRRESIDAGLDRLARVASGPPADLAAFCRHLLAEAGPERLMDDVAILAMRRTSIA